MHPNCLSIIAFSISCLCFFFILQESFIICFVLWWLGRLFDGIDGIYARQTNQASLFGGYLDIVLDLASYGMIIIGLYLVFPQLGLIWLGILFGYILCVTSVLALSSTLERLQHQLNDNRSLQLTPGLAEAGETGIAYSIFFLMPQYIEYTSIIWLIVVLIAPIEKTFRAWQMLKGK